MILAKSQPGAIAPPKEGGKEGMALDQPLAILCILYLMLIMPLYFWLLFDTWIGQK